MNQLDSLRAITRRQFRVNYRSPLICQLEASSSGSGSSISAFIPIERGPGPEALFVEAPVCELVLLEWPAVAEAIGYVAYVSSSPEGPWEPLIEVLLTETTLTQTVLPGTYYMKVTAVNPVTGETLPSPVVSVTVEPC